jgi:hypothetical protein
MSRWNGCGRTLAAMSAPRRRDSCGSPASFFNGKKLFGADTSRIQGPSRAIFSSFRNVIPRTPTAAATPAMRNAVSAVSGGPGPGRVWSEYEARTPEAFSARPVGLEPFRPSALSPARRCGGMGSQSDRRCPAQANPPSRSPIAMAATSRPLRTLASPMYDDSGGSASKTVLRKGLATPGHEVR